MVFVCLVFLAVTVERAVFSLTVLGLLDYSWQFRESRMACTISRCCVDLSPPASNNSNRVSRIV